MGGRGGSFTVPNTEATARRCIRTYVVYNVQRNPNDLPKKAGVGRTDSLFGWDHRHDGSNDQTLSAHVMRWDRGIASMGHMHMLGWQSASSICRSSKARPSSRKNASRHRIQFGCPMATLIGYREPLPCRDFSQKSRHRSSAPLFRWSADRESMSYRRGILYHPFHCMRPISTAL